MINGTTFVLSAAAACSLFTASSVLAGAHTWDVDEVFSTADGSIQFIELVECCGGNGEVNLNGLQVTSQATGNAFTFPSNLKSPTGNKRLLLATQSFADLPGAPTPDYIIQPNFFSLDGDTLTYHVYDSWNIAAGAVPTDCVNSLKRDGTVSPNTPTNYAGKTGEVDACPCVGDLSGDDLVNVFDLLTLLNAWGQCAGCPEDLNGDDAVNVFDLLTLLSAWGPCK